MKNKFISLFKRMCDINIDKINDELVYLKQFVNLQKDLLSFIEYAYDKGFLNLKDIVDYCQNIRYRRLYKDYILPLSNLIKEDEEKVRSLLDGMDVKLKVKTPTSIQLLDENSNITYFIDFDVYMNGEYTLFLSIDTSEINGDDVTVSKKGVRCRDYIDDLELIISSVIK